MAGVQGGLAVAGAGSRNASIEEAQRMAVANAVRGQSQIAAQGGLENLKRARDAARIEGRIRAAMSSGGGRTAQALQLQNVADASLDASIIRTNVANNIARVRSGAQAELIQLANQTVNPLLAGFQGGLQGFQQGVSISNSLRES